MGKKALLSYQERRQARLRIKIQNMMDAEKAFPYVVRIPIGTSKPKLREWLRTNNFKGWLERGENADYMLAANRLRFADEEAKTFFLIANNVLNTKGAS